MKGAGNDEEYTDEPCVGGCGAAAGEPCEPDCWVKLDNERSDDDGS